MNVLFVQLKDIVIILFSQKSPLKRGVARLRDGVCDKKRGVLCNSEAFYITREGVCDKI